MGIEDSFETLELALHDHYEAVKLRHEEAEKLEQDQDALETLLEVSRKYEDVKENTAVVNSAVVSYLLKDREHMDDRATKLKEDRQEFESVIESYKQANGIQTSSGRREFMSYVGAAASIITAGIVGAGAVDVASDGELDGDLAAAPSPPPGATEDSFDYAFMNKKDIKQASEEKGSTAINDLLGSDESIDVLTNGEGEELLGVVFQRDKSPKAFDSVRYDITVQSSEVGYEDPTVEEVGRLLDEDKAEIKATPGMEDDLYDDVTDYGKKIPDSTARKKIIGGSQ